RSVLVFTLLNLAAWIVYDRIAGSRSLGLLRVEQFQPGDGAVVAQARPTLSWKFNLDVAPTAADGLPPGTISPPVDGRWRWGDARTLSFEPSQDLPRATRLSLRLLPEHLRTPQGISMARSFVCAISTPAPAVVQVRQRSFDQQDRYVLEIEFSEAMAARD